MHIFIFICFNGNDYTNVGIFILHFYSFQFHMYTYFSFMISNSSTNLIFDQWNDNANYWYFDLIWELWYVANQNNTMIKKQNRSLNFIYCVFCFHKCYWKLQVQHHLCFVRGDWPCAVFILDGFVYDSHTVDLNGWFVFFNINFV